MAPVSARWHLVPNGVVLRMTVRASAKQLSYRHASGNHANPSEVAGMGGVQAPDSFDTHEDAGAKHKTYCTT